MQVSYQIKNSHLTLPNRYAIWKQHGEQDTEFKVQGYDKFVIDPSRGTDLMAVGIETARALRKENSYLRFWFSGGSDSTYALECFLSGGVFIDEIVSFAHDPMDGKFLSYAGLEVELQAWRWLEENQHRFPNTLISKFRITGEHYAAVFSTPEWWSHAADFTMSVPTFPAHFLRYVNPTHKLIEDIPQALEICGGTLPMISKNSNKIELHFADRPLAQDLHPRIHNWTVDRTDLGIMQTLINNVLAWPEDLHWASIGAQKDRIEPFGSMKLSNRFTIPKGTPRVNDDVLHQFNTESLKLRITLDQAKLINPIWFQHYKKSLEHPFVQSEWARQVQYHTINLVG